MAEMNAPVKKRVIGQQAYELNLSDYWRIVIRRKWIVLFMFVLVYIVSVAFTNLKTPIYQTQSTVRIVQEASISGFSPFMGSGFTTDMMASQAKLISSQAVAEQVVMKLGLVGETQSSEEIQSKIAEVQGCISTSREESTDMIHIIVTHPDPVLAAKIANSTAEEFKEVNLLEKNKKARNIREFVEKQIKLSQERLSNLEEKIRDVQELGGVAGVRDSLQSQLNGLQLQRMELLQIYTDKHPDVIALNEQIDSIIKELQQAPGGGVVNYASLSREMEVSERTYKMLKDKYEMSRIAEAEEVGDVSIVDLAAVPTFPISPNRKMNKMMGAVLGVIFGLLVALFIESLDTSIGTIEDLEHLVKLPVLGVIPYLLEDEANNRWNGLLRLFGRFPQQGGGPVHRLLIARLDPKSTMAEAYRILRTHISFTELAEGRGKVLVFTSTGPQEGKSVTCANLATSFSQSGKRVVLIDCDLRRSNVHHFFGVKRAPGLSDILLGTTKLEEAVKTVTDVLMGELNWDEMLKSAGLDHLSLITSGTKTPSPAELLATARMGELVEHLREEYDYVILDCPPILPVTDTMIVGKLADAVFMVYQAGRTARRALLRARDELEIAGINVKGIILNQANPDVKLGSTYYYQYKYYGDDSNN